MLHLLAFSKCGKVSRNMHNALQGTCGSRSTVNNDNDHTSSYRISPNCHCDCDLATILACVVHLRRLKKELG
jgi:hypothetical protein